MLDFFFDQSRVIQSLLLLTHSVVVALIAWLMMRWLGKGDKPRPDLPPVGPYFIAIILLYAMFLGFHASTIWAHQHDAELEFRDAVSIISRLEKFVGPNEVHTPGAQHALEAYVTAVIEDEWPNGNTRPSPRAIAALSDLRTTVVHLAETAPTAIGIHVLQLFDELVQTRVERLWVGTHNRNVDSWAVVLVLGLLSHIAIGFVHIDRPRAGTLSIALFAVATASAYWLLTDAINPFANVERGDAAQVWAAVRVE